MDYDLFVIGAGSGGVRAARIAASHGARVAIAEEYRYGGTCVIRGCIPKKLFVYASEYAHDFSDAEHYGWELGKPSFNWKRLVENKDREIERLSGLYRKTLSNFAVEMLDGTATLTGPNEVEVAGKKITAERILIATGGSPWTPEIPGIEHAISSNEAFHLESLPQSIAVVGGGYIAIEFAGIFRGLGCDVRLIHRRAEVLRGFDHDVRRVVNKNLELSGIELNMECDVTKIEQKQHGGLCLTLSNGETHDTQMVMYATGRRPKTAGLGLEEIGVKLGENGSVVVDDYSQTTVPHIYAVGDCTDGLALTPVAIRQGHAFADSVFGKNKRVADLISVPTAVFSQPPVGTVGLSEHDAREKYGRIDIYKSEFRPLRNTLTPRQDKVLIKMLVDCESQRVVGVHIVGKAAGEIAQAAAIAVRMGATKDDFDATVALHPTTAEELVLMRTKYEPPLPQS